MKTRILFSLAVLSACSLLAAESSPKDAVTGAAKSLAGKANYSWTTTTTVPEGSRWRPGPLEGKTDKEGTMHITITMGDNHSQAFLKGDKGAVHTGDGGWQSLAELENAEGGARFWARMLRDFKSPAAQVGEVVAETKDLKKDGEVFSGELTEAGAKTLLTFRRAGSDGPAVSGAKGSVKFWLKDGLLAKYEYKVAGKMTLDGNERDLDRTTTVEVKEVGSTKLVLPDEAKAKLN